MLKVLVVVLFLLCITASTNASRVTKEGAHRLPKAWILGARADPQQRLKLIFALKQSNLDRLNQLFESVSDPDSPSYAKYLTLDQIHQLVAPRVETSKAVLNWLSQFPLLKVTHQNDYIRVEATVEVAESMLGCEFHVFTHSKDKTKQLIRSRTPYSLPAEISEHVDFVGGVRHFPKLRKLIQSTKRNVEQNIFVTPGVLKQRYNIGDVVGKNPNNSQSCAQFLGQYFSETDLQEFFTLFLQSAIGNVPKVIGPNGFGAGVEASLDIEFIMSTGQHVPTVFWSTGGLDNGQEPFLEWLVDVGNDPKAPFVFSVSYGDDENSLSIDYVNRVEAEFKKQGLRGISILFASGDDGVGGDDEGCTAFVPNFPASSPSVTAVGGTTIDGFFELGKEVVNGLSGGGFSNYFAAPAYQTKAVQTYIQNVGSNLPTPSLWNKTGRAYPDIAALSDNFIVVVDLIPLPGVAGTSCAAPSASGIVSLLNDLRLTAGKPSLGFLNPLLYKITAQYPKAITDITEGSNPGCGTNGFPATTGWDPSSGWGSLNYAEFAKVVLNF